MFVSGNDLISTCNATLSHIPATASDSVDTCDGIIAEHAHLCDNLNASEYKRNQMNNDGHVSQHKSTAYGWKQQLKK